MHYALCIMHYELFCIVGFALDRQRFGKGAVSKHYILTQFLF